MHLDCRYRALVCRDDYYHYVQEVRIGVKEYAESCAEEFAVGRIVIDKILWADAVADGVSLFEICDADSQGMCDVHGVLTNGIDPQELRDDLEIELPVSDVLFVHRIVLHPDLESGDRIAILNAAIRAVTTDDALVVIWNNANYNTQFTEKEFAGLRFAKIADANLIYRDLHFQTTFDKEYPQGREVDLIPTRAHERWVRKEWRRTSKCC